MEGVDTSRKPVFEFTFICSPYTEYEFGVLAVNNVGRGPKSTPVIATTGETSNYSNYSTWVRVPNLM